MTYVQNRLVFAHFVIMFRLVQLLLPVQTLQRSPKGATWWQKPAAHPQTSGPNELNLLSLMHFMKAASN